MSDKNDWVTKVIGEILLSKNEKAKQLKSTEYESLGTYPVVDQSANFICGYHYDETKLITNDLPFTVFGDHTRHTKFISFPFIAGADGTQLLKARNGLDDKLFYYLIAFAAEKIGNYGYDRHFKHLKEFRCTFPTRTIEQSKIAEILSTVDRAIEQTLALLAKQLRIKTGLMQDLLTRGIDEQGNLRSEETHQFKDSPIGRIPVEWDTVPLRKLAHIKHGYAFAGEHFTDQRNKNVLLTPGNFHVKGGLYFTKDNTKYFTGAVPDDFVLSNGDVLVVMTDLTKEMTILSRTVVLNHPSNVLHNQRIGKVIANNGVKLNPHFLAILMNSDRHLKTIKSTATGTTVRHTSPDKILTPFVPEIEYDEQLRIRDRIIAVDLLIQRTSKELAKTENLKKGLMQDLLTGNKRVTQLLETAVTT
jgi:type I restriction enzyme, S subunit